MARRSTDEERARRCKTRARQRAGSVEGARACLAWEIDPVDRTATDDDQRLLDLTRVEGFDWAAGNRRKSAGKHGVTPAEAEQVFFCEKLY